MRAARGGDRLAAGPAAAVAVLLLVWTAALVWELPLGSDHVELYADWDHQLLEAEVAARAVRAGEAPFWNPHPCGGLPALAAPLSRVASPFFPLHLLLGASRALRIEIVLHLLIAAVGAALLVAWHVPGPALARATAMLLGAFVYSGSSFFALHLTEGHLWILSAAYLPLVLLCFERGVDRPLFAVLCGALLALMLGEGGALPLPMAVLLLVASGLVLAVRRRSLRPLSALAIVGGVSILLSAPKLLPMLELLGRNPREALESLVLPPEAVLHALLDRDQALRRHYDWLYWGWQEQGHYIGVAALALAALGSLRRTPPSLRYVGLALAFALVAMGPFHALAPWHALHRLPLFDALHVTSRFLVVSVLLLAVLAGLGGAALLARIASPRVRGAVAALLVLGVGADLLSARHGIFGVLSAPRCPLRPWPADAPRGDPFVTLAREPLDARRCAARGAFVRSAMVPAARAGVGIVRAYNALCPREVRTDEMPPAALLPRARVPAGLDRIRVPRNFGRRPGLVGADEPGYRGEVWVARGGGRARIAARSASTQVLHVETPGPARLVLNQNWDPGWRSEPGRVLGDRAGRLVIDLSEPLQGELRLRYRPPYWGAGLALAAAGLAAVGLAFVRDRRTPGGVGPDSAAPRAPCPEASAPVAARDPRG